MVTQEQIDRVDWYHDFDFPGGLHARTHHGANAAFFRLSWRFLSDQLSKTDFSGKTVIDVGCWDGYFSFLMERLGAESVLAVDDISQNWGSGEGFRIARELFGSRVELMQDVSVYDLSRRIPRQFDIILFAGVYYHLHSPFNAFAEIRALCHEQSMVIVAGQCARNEIETTARFQLVDPERIKFLPTSQLLRETLQACYFEVTSAAFLSDVPPAERIKEARPLDLLNLARAATKSRRSGKAVPIESNDTVVLTARPFVKKNSVHKYPPPFGLARYDPRWAE